jgi:uncharacterized membrane protein YgcG
MTPSDRRFVDAGADGCDHASATSRGEQPYGNVMSRRWIACRVTRILGGAPMRRRIGPAAAAAALVGALAIALAVASSASAQSERITAYDVTIAVQHDGNLQIDERIDYDFGSSRHHGITRTIPVVYRFDSTHDRVYRLTVRRVTASGGAPAGYDVSRDGENEVIKIGDPDVTITGTHTYDIAYTVVGALNRFASHDELYWNAIGDEWDVPISDASVHVTVPGTITQVACFQGSQGSSLPCDESSFDRSGSARFGSSSLGPYEGLTVVVGMTKGDVSPEPAPILVERWSLGRAFTVNPATGGLAAVLLIGFGVLFGRLAWRTGRDRRYVGSAVDVAFGPSGTAGGTPPRPDEPPRPVEPLTAEPPTVGSPPDEVSAGTGQEQAVPLFERSDLPIEFEPPERLRPGEIGTLLDEVAGTVDVSATIVDLAVRGYITIEEIPKHGLFGKPDWRLTQLKQPDGALKPYESKLLTSLFEDAADGGDDAGSPGGHPRILMSSLRTKFAKKLLDVESSLYDDTVRQGWFRARPDKVRAHWRRIAWLVLIVGCVLEYFAIRSTRLALLPAVVIVAGLFMLFAAKRMPARTAKGTGVLRRTLGFREFVAHGTEAAKARFAEKENLFSEYLPYAIVFGVTERWAKVFEHLSDRPPDTSWYVSPHPFTYASFSSSMDHFTTTTSGTIASTPAGSGSSGFGGGGFSGGGGGGGGGGSW